MTEESKQNEITRLVSYTIIGKIKKFEAGKLLNDLQLVAYAARDKKVLGSAPINNDGVFEIKYMYKGSGRENKPIGTYLIIGPSGSADQILKIKHSRAFLSSRAFSKASNGYLCKQKDPFDFSEHDIYKYKSFFTYSGYIRTCSPLVENASHPCPLGCGDPGSLSTSENLVYIRISRGGKIIGDDIPVSDGSESPESISGKFSLKEVVNSSIPPVSRTAFVEIYQKMGGITNIIYSGDLTFENNFPKYVCIDRDTANIIEIPVPDGAGAGRSFGFSRVGYTPIEYINQVTGFVDSSGAPTDSTIPKFKDFAFGGELHLYGNIGEDLLIGGESGGCQVKYFRIKYKHLDTGNEGYIHAPFSNAREPRAGEGEALICESMGPLPLSETKDIIGVYRYANPYETAALYPGTDINDWQSKGLLLKVWPQDLDYTYGKYRLTIEPLDSDMKSVDVETPNDYYAEFVLLIDNDISALTGDIKDIEGVAACGFLDLRPYTPGDVELNIQFDIENSRGTLGEFQLVAEWGKNSSELLLEGKYPSYPGKTPITPPEWKGEKGIDIEKIRTWVECAHQFRLWARRRVTNGITEEYWITVSTKHITILSKNVYNP